MSFTYDQLKEYIDILVKYGPTVLFAFIVVIATLVGFLRGKRKSRVLFVQSFVCFAVCFILYIILVNSTQVDALFVQIANMIIGSDTGLQDNLGVSQDCTTLKEILVEFIAMNCDFGVGISLILEDNGTYLLTLVYLAYHLVFAVLMLAIYYVAVLISWLCYLIFNNKFVYRRKLIYKQAIGAEPYYSTGRLKGALIGLGRGLISGTLILSLLGTVLYIAAGTGEGTMEDYDFEDEDVNFYYSSYQSIERYGTYGIYKVLNTVKDVNDTPYYLYAMDLVFQGKLDTDDTNATINDTVYFRQEIGAYTSFTKDTVRLLLKYGGAEIRDIILGNASSDEDITNAVIEVLSIPGFQEEFEESIVEFDSNSYFLSFAMSLINSAVSHMDDVAFFEGMDPTVKEMLQVIFQPGYYSDIIPSEKTALEKAGGDTTKLETLPYIKASDYLKRQDVVTALDIVFEAVNNIYDLSSGEVDPVVNFVCENVHRLESMSIFQTERADELNPVLSRVYDFVSCAFLNVEDDSYTMNEKALDNVNWVQELNTLLDLVGDIQYIYKNVDFTSDTLEAADYYNLLFKDSENRVYVNRLVGYLEQSTIIGAVLSSSLIFTTIRDAMTEVFPDFYLYPEIQYANTYDDDGNLVSHGEIYCLLEAVLQIADNPDNDELMEGILSGNLEIDDTNASTYLNAFFVKNSEGIAPIDYAANSMFINGVLTSVFKGYMGDYLIIPDSTLMTYKNEKVNLLTQDELGYLVDAFKVLDVGSLISSDFSDSSSLTSLITNIIEEKDTLLQGNIIEPTLVNALINEAGLGDQVDVSDRLKEAATVEVLNKYDGSNPWHNELSYLLDAIDEIFELSKGGTFDSAELEDKVVGLISSLNDTSITDSSKTKLDVLYTSEIISYTFTEYLSDMLSSAIDEEVIKDCKNNLGLFKKSEISSIVSIADIYDVDFTTDFDSDTLLGNVQSSFDILNDTIASYEFNGKYTGKSRLNIIYASTIVKYYLADTLDKTFGPDGYGLDSQDISSIKDGKYYAEDDVAGLIRAYVKIKNGDDSITIDNIGSKLSTLINDFDDDLIDTVYESKILELITSKEVDNILTEQNLLDATACSLIKKNGLYPKSEIKAFFTGLKDGLGIDLDSASSAEFSFTKVKELNKTNDKHPESTSLELIYDSKLLVCIVSKLFDGQLDDSIISQSTLEAIKDNNGDTSLSGYYYSLDEMKNLIDGINEMGLDDLSGFDSSIINDLNKSSTVRSGETKLEVMYSSKIVAGIITKMVKDQLISGDALQDNPDAYESTYGTIKESEIKSLVNIIGDNTLETFNFDSLSLKDLIKEYDNGTKDFSLLTAAVSKNLIDSDLIIPLDAFKYNNSSYVILKYTEVYHLFVVLDEIGISDISSFNFDNFRLSAGMKDNISASEILRATISGQLTFDDDSIIIYSKENETTKGKDYKYNDILLINDDEFSRFYDALLIFSGGGKITDMQLSLTTVVTLTDEKQSTILESNIARFILSKQLEDYANTTEGAMAIALLGISLEYDTPCEVYNLKTRVKETSAKQFYTKESLKEALNSLSF